MKRVQIQNNEEAPYRAMMESAETKQKLALSTVQLTKTVPLVS